MAVKPITVSQLIGYVDRKLKSDPVLDTVVVRGEVSGFWLSDAGYGGFELKDEAGIIKCFYPDIPYGDIDTLKNGENEIIVTGKVSVYKKGGRIQIYVKALESGGQADMARAFIELKEKLAKEGLFDEKYKKRLPFFPDNIAIVTSDSGAAVQDLIDTITERNDHVNIYICPVLVQGEKAPYEISSMIDALNKTMPELDLMIVGRGGGSAEDLAAFNDERVARSIFASNIPVISAVGHETDFSISDMVADVSAITPTKAALFIPDTYELRLDLEEKKEELSVLTDSFIHKKMLALKGLKDVLVSHEPVMKQEKKMADIVKQMDRNITYRIADARETLIRTDNALKLNIRERLHDIEKKLRESFTIMENSNPVSIMERGYAAVTGKDGKTVTGIGDISVNEQVVLRFSNGAAGATINSVKEDKI